MNSYKERVLQEQQQVVDQLQQKRPHKAKKYMGNIVESSSTAAPMRRAKPAPPPPPEPIIEQANIDELFEQQAMEAPDEAEVHLQSRAAFFGGGGGGRRQAGKRENAAANRRSERERAAAAAANEGGSAVDVRITGFWRKTVIVPPNAWVVQTRRGHDEPIALGLGKSLRFQPKTDAILVVPATLQTLILSAESICQERQGLLVQGYVQWVVDDFRTAYRRIDFSDPDDPMRIVRTQLREQAEATIKDTVATMTIEQVLADKQPIIKELTRRLRELAEGHTDNRDASPSGESAGSGLGIKILTVQIKEAIVSSESLWESLQRPYRAEQQRIARLAELRTEEEIREAEAKSRREQEARDLETKAEADRRRAELDAERFRREQEAAAERSRLQAEQQATKMEAERSLAQQEHELAIQKMELDHEREERRNRFQLAQQRAEAEQVTELEAHRRQTVPKPTAEEVEMARLRTLPQIISALPRLEGLESLHIDGRTIRSLEGLLSSRREGSGRAEIEESAKG